MLGHMDMESFGLKELNEWFEQHERNDKSRQEDNEEYNKFLEKFEPKKTTDDCYTPDLIYNTVAEWVENEYNVSKKNFVRPFYPGGDYKSVKYKDEDIVVDNPPFSILAEILKFYHENNIKCFLFAPHLTLFSSNRAADYCAVCAGAAITYENGAVVETSFLTNLEEDRARSAPTLWQAIKEAAEKIKQEAIISLPKYIYPDNVITATDLDRLSKYGVEYSFSKEQSFCIRELDMQKEQGKSIYGGGFLISEKAAAEKAAAEKAAAAAATVWKLSDREKEIIKSLA